MTMTLVSTVTVGSGGAASIDFNSLPQTGTDLYIVVSARTAASQIGDNCKVTINGVTTNQTSRRLYGVGTTIDSDNLSYIIIGNINGNTATTNAFGCGMGYIRNYTGSTNKSFASEGSSETNGSSAYNAMQAGLWSNSAAITSISLTTETGSNFLQYSTASLYTITKGSGGATVS
jgi:hypothetical protein